MEATSTTPLENGSDAALAAAIERIRRLTAESELAADDPASSQATAEKAPDAFTPMEPASFQAAQLSESEVEALVLKFLLARGDATGRDVAAICSAI